jgi:DNA-binding CsgD family transcriptional regulator
MAREARIVKRNFIILLMVLVQTIGALFFIGNITMTVLGIERQPIDWKLREAVEIGAAVALLIGLVMSGVLLMQSQRRLGLAEARLKRASNAFMEVVEESFTNWGLTRAERDVAFFVLKGFSTQEIAGFRRTSEGTVKAQTNAIYRKAGVNGRGQLMSIFIDDLLAETRGTTDPLDTA